MEDKETEDRHIVGIVVGDSFESAEDMKNFEYYTTEKDEDSDP